MKISSWKNRLKHFFPVLFWIMIWYVTSLLVNKEVYLPGPLSVLKTLSELLRTHTFYFSILSTILRALVSFVLSVIFGIIVGFICYFNKRIMKLLNPLISSLRSTPIVSIIFLIVIYVKLWMVPLLVSFLISFPLIFSTVVHGLEGIDSNLIRMTKVYNVSFFKRLFIIYLPGIFTNLSASMINSLGLTWKAIATTEALTHPYYSIGKYLSLAKSNIDISSLFAWTIMLLLLSGFTEKIIKLMLHKAQKKRFRM